MYDSKIWYETLHIGFGQYFNVDREIYRKKTAHQDLIIFENSHIGRIMALDGIIQTTEKDEFIYHEMMTHVPILTHGNVGSVLIIGGGDGGILRETVRHSTIKEITMVEIDTEVIELCRRYLPNHSANSYEDPRVRLVIDDGASFVRNTASRFDIIISDSTDPVGPGESLFNSEFYSGCAKVLNEGGIFVSQNGVCFLQRDEVKNSYQRLCCHFDKVGFYQVAVPTYYGGIMTLSWATQGSQLHTSNTETLRKRFISSGIACSYYNPEIHVSSFSLPQYLIKMLSSTRSCDTNNQGVK